MRAARYRPSDEVRARMYGRRAVRDALGLGPSSLPREGEWTDMPFDCPVCGASGADDDGCAVCGAGE